MSKSAAYNYLKWASLLYEKTRHGTRYNADSNSTYCDDNVQGIRLAREQIADKVGRRADDRTRKRSEQYSRKDYRQIFKRNSEKSSSEI